VQVGRRATLIQQGSPTWRKKVRCDWRCSPFGSSLAPNASLAWYAFPQQALSAPNITVISCSDCCCVMTLPKACAG